MGISLRRATLFFALCAPLLAPGENALYVGWHRPTEDVLLDISVQDNRRSIIRVDDFGTVNTNRHAVGQTFQLDGPEPTATVGRAAVQISRPLTFDDGPHTLQAAFLKDTNGSGIGDTLVGAVQFFDASGLTGENTHFLTFEFAEPVVLETGVTHSFEFWFTKADPLYTQGNRVGPDETAVNLQVWRGDGTATVGTAGYHIEGSSPTIGTAFPFGELLSNGGQPNRQMSMVLQGPRRPGFDWSTVPELYPGIQHLHLTTNQPRTLNIHVLRVDLANPDIRLHTTGRHSDWGTAMSSYPQFTNETRRRRTRDYVVDQRNTGMNMVAAINASPWLPWDELPDWVFIPGTDKTTFPHADITGLAVSEGLLVSPGEEDRPALIYYKDWTAELAFAPEDTDTSRILTAVSAFRFALRNGGIQGNDDVTDNRNIRGRTSFGFCRANRFLLLKTIDETQGATVAESGRWLEHFGAWNGLQMDGGGSTMMAIVNPDNSNVQVVNNPTSTWPHGTRLVGNSVGIYYITEPEEIPVDNWLAYRDVPEPERGDGTDVAGDGIVNLLKYTWNIHPLTGHDPADAGALPVYERIEEPEGGRYMSITYRLNRHAVDANLVVETTDDLPANDWTIPNQLFIDPLAPDPVTHDPRYRARVPADSEEPLFMRLRAIRIDP